MGAILMDILKDAINPLIIYVIIIATIIAILDFAEFLPAFSIAFFAGYVVEFLRSFAWIFDGYEIPALILSLIGMAAVVAMKLRYPKDRRTL
jgi:L-lactate permease